MTGRRLVYTAEIAQRLLSELTPGRSLRAVCREQGIPHSTVRQWVSDDREGFATRYRQARTIASAGRPTLYTADIADRILDQLSDGRALAEVCRDPGMPSHPTVRQWEKDNREGFGPRYRTARQIGYDTMADEILEIADDSRRDWTARRKPDGRIEHVINDENICRARLRINARRWRLSKALPRQYGKRPDPNASHEPRDTLAELMKQIEEQNRALAKP
jgi:transposase-like protein